MRTSKHHRNDPPPRLPGYAGLAPADVADARRRRPDADLRPYALARGLEYLGSGDVAGFERALPFDPELQFNVLRVPAATDGREAILYHWVRPWPVEPDGQPVCGTFFGRVWRPHVERERWWKYVFDPSYLPWIGWLFDFRAKGVRSQPDAIGVPCTVAAARVPEALGLPNLTIDNFAKPAIVGCHRERLAGRGLAGWTLLADAPPPEALVERLLSPAVRRVLGRGAGNPLFELRVRGDAIAVVRNGFVARDGELDALLEAAATAADALRDAIRELPPPLAAPPVAAAGAPGVRAGLTLDLRRRRRA